MGETTFFSFFAAGFLERGARARHSSDELEELDSHHVDEEEDEQEISSVQE